MGCGGGGGGGWSVACIARQPVGGRGGAWVQPVAAAALLPSAGPPTLSFLL